MQRKLFWVVLLMVVSGLIYSPGTAAAQANDSSVVHAVLFFSPTCPHCHKVINDLLLPMVKQYGNRLQIMTVNIAEEQGQQLYRVAIDHYQIPNERQGVPTLIVKDEVLVGSAEIPEKFPKLVEAGLTGGGIDWPGIPGLAPIVAAQAEKSTVEAKAPAVTGQPAATAAPKEAIKVPVADIRNEAVLATPAPAAAAISFGGDPVGMGLAWLVLVITVAGLAFTLLTLIRYKSNLRQFGRELDELAGSAVIPLLVVLGLGVSGYLTYVETNHVEAVCGPVGNCNQVQSSSYAQIFGVPIAVWGLLNYGCILVLWLIYRYSTANLADLALPALLAFAVAGTVFSAYLTVLEIFVIHAVCIWCLSSAVITTAIMLTATMPIRAAAPPTQPSE